MAAPNTPIRSRAPLGVSSYDNLNPDATTDRLKELGQGAWESLPGIGTAYTIQDIKEELAKEEPNYYMIGALTGAEVIGLIPGLGTAAKKAIREGAKKVGLEKTFNQMESLISKPEPKADSKIFGGIGAEGMVSHSSFTAKDKNLKKAIKLLKKSGVDPMSGPSNARPIYKELGIYEVNKDIWEKTGWYVDPTDGQWRFEIDDSKSNLKDFKSVFKTNKNPDDPADNPNLSSSFFEELGKVPRSKEDGVYNKLGNVLEHEEFFKRYPDLKDVDVIFYSDPNQRNLLGSASEDEIFVNISAYRDYESIKSTLLHEIQHIIQAEEDFVPGSSSKYIPNFLTENKSRELKTKIDPLKVQERKLQAELDLLIPHRKNIREKYANNPLKNLSESDQIAIYKLKPFNKETGIHEGPSWASIAKDYGVTVQEVKTAYGREQLLEKINKDISKYTANLNKIINDLYELEKEDFKIDTNFYRGAGGEIEARLVQYRKNLSPEERGKSFPIDDRLIMLQGEGGKFEYTGKHGVDPHQYTLKPRNEPEEEKSFLSKVGKKLGFNEGGDVSAQMQSYLDAMSAKMIPSADSDPAPPRKDNFTAASFAEDSWEETKKRFMDAGRIDVNPDDPAIFTAYKRAVDYLKDTGLAGLGLADTAFKYAVGSVAQVMPTEALEKRMARDLYSMPEAFAGAAGARSLTQLDDAADAFLEGSLHVARKAGQIKPDPNTLASFAGAVPPTYIKREAPIKKKLKDYGFRTDNPATKGYDGGEEWLKNKQKRAEESGDPTLLRGPITGYLGRESNPLFINTNALLELKGASGEKRYPGESQYDSLRARVEERGFDPEQKYSPDDEYGSSVIVGVNHKGEAFIIEGNTRVAVANDLNVPSLRVEVRYFNGAENVKGPYSPENIINRSSGLLDQAKKDAKDKEAFSDYLDLRNMGILQFREPISEFIETLTIPKKGMLGSEFLNQIKKNSSIPETSLQEGIIDPSKRYTKEELLGAIGVGKNTQGTFRSVANISPYRIKQFEGNQRQQKDAGFQGGNEVEYFDIPVDTTIGYPGKPFRASSQHYNPETLVHVRGSIVNPRGRTFYPREIEEFDKILGGKNYLLAEEIQSDLLTKGYVKPNNFFDALFSEVTKHWTASNLITYQEAFGDIDKEIKKILKLLEDPSSAHLSPGRVSDNPKFYRFYSPDVFVHFKDLREKGLKDLASLDRIDYEDLSDLLIRTSATEKDIDQVFETLKADILPDGSPILLRKSEIGSMRENDDDIIDVDFLDRDELLKLPEVSSILDEGIKEDFLNYHNKRQKDLDSATEEYLNFLQSQIDKLKINDTIDVIDLAKLHESMIRAKYYTLDTSDIGLPPIRKNKQAVDEALKVLIAKAAQSGVDKIVIPPASRIALARGRELKKEKGDRFYRTYVTDLNKSLKELEENYPVVIHRDVEMPYYSKDKTGTTFLQPLEDDEFDTAREALGDEFFVNNPELLPLSQKEKTINTGDNGTIIDISELVNRFKVEQPRQFAQGGVAMNEQMEMAFMQQGGLKDDGMNQDPVSGNEVPSGSMASEVRDDIPAQLSEGEYVVPADVVRYFGVKHFEDLRNKAKGGLNKMEADGRIGGEPVPVGGPKADLRPDELQEIQNMFKGGMVAGAAEGADFSFYNPKGSTTEEAVTTPTRYTGEFSFEQPGTGSPPPVVGEPVQSENNIVTLYGPNGEVLSLMLPRDQAMYDQLIAQGYTLEVRQGQSESKDSDPEVPTTDPNAWMDKYDYTNSDVLMQQSLDALDPKEGFAGVVGKVFGGGIFGQLSSASNAAQIAANIRLLNSQGVDTTELQTKLDTYIKTNNIGWMPKSWIDGDQLEGDVREQIGDDLFTQGTKVYTVPETKTIMQDAAKDTVIEPTSVGKGRVYKPEGIDVALTSPPDEKKKKSDPSFHDQYTAAVKKSREKSEASRQAMQRAQDKDGSSENIADLKKKYEKEGGTWASGGRARGGLMKKKKKNKK